MPSNITNRNRDSLRQRKRATRTKAFSSKTSATTRNCGLSKTNCRSHEKVLKRSAVSKCLSTTSWATLQEYRFSVRKLTMYHWLNEGYSFANENDQQNATDVTEDHTDLLQEILCGKVRVADVGELSVAQAIKRVIAIGCTPDTYAYSFTV